MWFNDIAEPLNLLLITYWVHLGAKTFKFFCYEMKCYGNKIN